MLFSVYTVSNTVYCAITSTPTVYDSSVNIQKRSSPTQSMTTTQTIVMPTTPITSMLLIVLT